MEQKIVENVVNQIMTLWDSGEIEDSKIIEMLLSKYTMSNDDAELILELTKTGVFRALIISEGHKYPSNNLQDNQFVDTAIKLKLTILGKPELYKPLKTKKAPWWKFWKSFQK